MNNKFDPLEYWYPSIMYDGCHRVKCSQSHWCRKLEHTSKSRTFIGPITHPNGCFPFRNKFSEVFNIDDMQKQDVKRTTAPSAGRNQKMPTLAGRGHFK